MLGRKEYEDASSRPHTNLRGSLDLVERPRITLISLCSEAEDENVQNIIFLVAMLGLHKVIL